MTWMTGMGRVQSAALKGTGRSRCETATWRHWWQLSHSLLTFMAAPAGTAEGRIDGGQRHLVPPERPAATAAKRVLKVQREPVAVTSPAKVLVHAQGFALFKVPPPVALRPAAEGVARRNSRLPGGGGCRASRSRGR